MKRSTLTGDILGSVFAGGLMGFLYFFLFESLGVTDFVFRQVGLAAAGGRFGVEEFVVMGALLGIILNLVGKFMGLPREVRA